jgi:centrin-1
MISDLERENQGNIDFDRFLDSITSKLVINFHQKYYTSPFRATRTLVKEFRKFSIFLTTNVKVILQIFLFYSHFSGQISLKNLKRVARELGETMTDEELREMIERADSNGDGEISMEVRKK